MNFRVLLWSLLLTGSSLGCVSHLAVAATDSDRNINERLAQNRDNTTVVEVTSVTVQATPTGLDIILETATGMTLQATTRTQDNTLISNIPNAVLKSRKNFQADNPTTGITQVTVTQQPQNRLEVRTIGTTGVPTAKINTTSNGLAIAVTPAPEEEIEIVVTGEQDEGYAVPNASVGTRTDTPLRDIPQSIQVVPRQAIEDQGATEVDEVLRNVSGISQIDGLFSIRGFDATDNFFSDGARVEGSFRRTNLNLSNIEQVEVLKGPASVLYGNGEPGGTINFVTEQPLTEPAYDITGTIGNFDFYRSTADLTGPLNDARTILYRLNVAYENSGSFVGFVENEQFFMAPVLSFQLGERTTLTFEGSYERISAIERQPLPTIGTVLPNPLGQVPRSRFLGEPDNKYNLWEGSVGYRLNHQFSDRWSLRNRFIASFSTFEENTVGTDGGLEALEADNRTVLRFAVNNRADNESYILQTDVNGKFNTGIIAHNLLLGVELQRNVYTRKFAFADAQPIDLFEPEYGNFAVPDESERGNEVSTTDIIGVYAQDLLAIGEQVKILLGGRFDWYSNDFEDKIGSFSENTEVSRFSPRVGLVYQPIEPVSLYASWSRSFVPQTGIDREGNQFEPTLGEQFEVGVKTELLDGRLIATLAAYHITRQNDLVEDPDDSDFQIQLGETRSQGIEFDLAGEPLPGLRLIANYAYTDAKITEDTRGFEDNQIVNIPEHSGSLWAVYELQQGTLEGLGFGAGIFAADGISGDLENSYEIPGYLRTDALLYYRRDNWRVQLNFENLFDNEYFENSGRYGQPFTIRGRVSVKF
jgi:iron complex outermembrane recepter protein